MKSMDDVKRRLGSRNARSKFRSMSLALLLVTSVALAGCSGVPFMGGGGPSVDASQELTSKMSVSPVTVYQRVEEMTGVENAEYPDIEVVYQGTDTNAGWERNSTGTFLRSVVGPQPEPESTIAENEYMYDPIDEVIRINISVINEASEEELQTIVAGEFFRAYMYQQNWTQYNIDTQWLEGPVANLSDVDGMMPLAVTRGGVNYVQQSYIDQHLEGADIEIAPDWTAEDTVYDKWHSVTRSRLGMQYLQETLDSPSGLVDFYSGDLPVVTTEQMIHRNDEAAGQIETNIQSDNWWNQVQRNVRGPTASLIPDPRDPRGELGTRFVLEAYHSDADAESAAAGWAADQPVVFQSFRNESDRGVVWAHEWDSSSEADEFVSAMESFAEQRNQRSDIVELTVERPQDTVTIVVAGSPTFHEEVTYEYTDGTLSVTAGDVN